MNNGHGLKPFTCYFCNQTIKNETEIGHRSTCGSLLEPCPYKCGAYTPRNMKARHLTECPNRPRQYNSNTLKPNVLTTSRNSLENKRTQRHSMDAGLYLNDNFPQNYQQNPQQTFLQEEIALLRSKLQNMDTLYKNLSQNLSLIKKKNDETFHNHQTAQIHNKLEIDKVLYQNQTMMEWKKLVETQLESLRQQMRPYERMKSEIDATLQNIKAKISTLDNLQVEMSSQKDVIVREQIYNREVQTDFRGKINEMKDFFMQENAVSAAVWNDHKVEIDKLKEKSASFDKLMDEQKAKYASVVFDVRAAMGLATECTEKLELQERAVGEMKKELSQFKFDMEVLEESASHGLISNKPGHLIWKLSNFNTKMDNAKENNTVLKSPIFYSHYYGYKIRLLVYLNGIKKWKGRHLIACIHVLNGEYDPLLKWPCNIEGTIALRDIQDISNPKDYSKFITARRNSGDEENEDPQESSTQYIFIPHTTLTKSNFLQDDTVFIEVKINQPNKKREETPL